MTSWVTFARPFAARRAIYKQLERSRLDYWARQRNLDVLESERLYHAAERSEMAKQAIEHLWFDFKKHMNIGEQSK